jgi:single-stranded DNA-binding protein
VPDYEPKPIKHIAGVVGQDPEQKQGGGYDPFVSFSLAVTRSYGDDGETRWYSVAVNKEALQNWVMQNIQKGSRVVVEGVLSKRDYQGKDYFNASAFRVGLIDWAVVNQSTMRPTKAQQAQQFEDDDDL